MISKLVFPIVFLAVVQAKVLDLSCLQIKKFVDGHNSRRLELLQGLVPQQPAAKQMKMMIWDEELAAKAAKWASLGKFSHNPDNTIASGRFRTGENLYWLKTSDNSLKTIDPDAPLEDWWAEHEKYVYGNLTMEDFTKPYAIGHYTQMAWSDSTCVGCAIARIHLKHGSLTNQFSVVCNYGPNGNLLGRRPYLSTENVRYADKTLTCASVNNCKKMYGSRC